MAKPDTISVTVQDENNLSSVVGIHVGAAFIHHVANLPWANFLLALEELMKGRITKIQRTVNIPIAQFGFTRPAALVGSDVEEGARVIFETAFPSYPSFTIPTYNETATLVNTKRLDPNHPELAALIAAMIAMGAQDAHGEDITTFREGYEVFAGQRREE